MVATADGDWSESKSSRTFLARLGPMRIKQLEEFRQDLLSRHYKPKNIEDTFKHVTQIEKNEA